MLKKILITIVLLLIAFFSINTLMAQKNNLKIGDQLPKFTLKDQNNNDFNITNYVTKNILVIYFYPKDDTPGCTKEACAFRDEFQDFTDQNAMVIGISSDGVKSHKKFADKYNLPFTLLADTNKDVQKLFGVPKSIFGLVPGRVTYIFNKKGNLAYVFNSLTKAEKHIKEAKNIIKNLQ